MKGLIKEGEGLVKAEGDPDVRNSATIVGLHLDLVD